MHVEVDYRIVHDRQHCERSKRSGVADLNDTCVMSVR